LKLFLLQNHCTLLSPSRPYILDVIFGWAGWERHGYPIFTRNFVARRSRVATTAHFGLLLVREMDSEVVVGRGVAETEVVEEPGVVRAVD
jgi:hypothetical protein